MGRKKSKKQEEVRSYREEFEQHYEDNLYLIDLALEQGEFEDEQAIDDWYCDALFVKFMFPEIEDQLLMPIELDEILEEFGLVPPAKLAPGPFAETAFMR